MTWHWIVMAVVVLLIIAVLKFESVEVQHYVSVKINGRKLSEIFKKVNK